MALYGRANSNIFSLLNHCYCKFMTRTVELKSGKHTSVLSNFQKPNKTGKKSGTSNIKATFEAEISNRRNQACRSILVQVFSLNSYDDLQNYCSQFGKVLSMHHYRINKQQNYILVEFKDAIAVNELLACTSFVDSDLVIPVKSQVLWFRKGQVVNQRNSYKGLMLTTENGCTCPSENQITDILQSAKSISGQIIALYDALKLSELEIRLRFHTAHHLEQFFSKMFCNMRVLPFGSSINGFGRKRCDLDLVLLSDDTNKKNFSNRLVFHSKPMDMNGRQETKEFMGILASTMRYFMPGINNVRKILEARVPIIKFNYEYTHLECDLSTTNMTAIYMSELLSLYGEIDWRVRPLIIAIRKWAKSQDITSDAPGQWITNFSLSLLVIFYLQQKKILPSLKTLKSGATHEDIRHAENGINCTFLRNIQNLPPQYKYKSNQDNLEKLLHDFFEYYSTFDFYTKGICIREGTPIGKPSRSALHIVNPFETTLNVSKNVNVYELNRITGKAHDALFVLETIDTSTEGDWGLTALLKMKKNVIHTNIPKLNSAEEQSVEDDLKSYSHEISNKIIPENSETDINQPEEEKGTV